MKDTGRNTNKIENNKKIVKEKEKTTKKQNKKNLPTKNFKNFCKRKKKTINMKVMLLNLKIKDLYCSVLCNH